MKYESIEHSAEFTGQFKSLKHLNNGEAVIYKSLPHRSIIEKDICAVTGLVDSELARCVDTKRSINGFIFLLGCCIISWQTK